MPTKRVILVVFALLLVLAAAVLLAYALLPLPVESLRVPVAPALLTPPGVLP
jgi:hypothetical protein